MAYQLATAFVSVQAKNGLSAAFAQIKGQVGSLLTGIGNISPVLGAVAGFAGLTYAINNAMGAAEDAINAEARLNAVIRATGNVAGISSREVLEMSKNLQNSGIFASTDITKATTALIQMRAVTRDSFPEIIRLSQDVAAAGFGSVESAARTLGKALADPARGLFRLRSIGITFTQDEQTKIHALAKVNDLLGAQKIILDKVRNSVGGTNEALAQTPAGRWEQIKHQLADISEELGKHILPIAVRIGNEVLRVTKIVAPLVNRVLDINEHLKGWPVKIGMAALAAYVLAKGVGKVTSAWEDGMKIITEIGASFGGWGLLIAGVIAGVVVEYSAIWWYLNRFPKFTAEWSDFTTRVWVAVKQVWEGTKEVFLSLFDVVKLLMPEWLKQLPIIKQLLEEGIIGALVKILEMVGRGITVMGALSKTINDIASEGLNGIRDGLIQVHSTAKAIELVFEGWVSQLRSVVSMLEKGAGYSLAIRGTGALGRFHGGSASGGAARGLLESAGLGRFTAGIRNLGRAMNPEWFRKLYNENLKNAKLDIELAKLAAKRKKEEATRNGGLSGAGGGAGFLDIAPGLSSLQDAWKNMQEALLKRDDPAERTAAGVETLNGAAQEMIEELARISSKLPAVA